MARRLASRAFFRRPRARDRRLVGLRRSGRVLLATRAPNVLDHLVSRGLGVGVGPCKLKQVISKGGAVRVLSRRVHMGRARV